MTVAPGGSAERSRARIDALSDGVFAIALTLLTLNVRLDQGPHETFAHALRASVPELGAYALSFAVIALFWIGHHRLFTLLDAVDHRLVLFNFVYLGLVALVPFPSQVLGHYGGEAGAVVLYASIVGVACCASSGMWFYARRRGLFSPETPPTLVTHSALRALVLAFAFALSIPVALAFGAPAGQWTWALGIPARLLLWRRYGDIHDADW